MAEAVEEILEEVHGELTPLEGEIPWTHDAKKATTFKEVPSVQWRYADFDHGEAGEIGGKNAAIGSREQALILTVRHKTKLDAIRTVEQLQRCFRRVVSGPNFRFGKFSWVSDDVPANLAQSVKAEGPVMVRVQIRRDAEAKPTAKITQQTHSVKINDEEVC